MFSIFFLSIERESISKFKLKMNIFFPILIYFIQFCSLFMGRLETSILFFQIIKNTSYPFYVSIIIPIYNTERYLNRSFGSLFNQTLQNYEIIVIDDCSQDESLKIIQDKMKTSSHIKLVQHFYNQGTLSSRNHGVIESSGQFIMSLDPDDQLFNDAIEKSYKSIVEFDADVLEFSLLVQYNSTNKTEKCKNSYNSNTVIFRRLLKLNPHKVNWNVCKKIIKRSVYLKAVELILPFIKNKMILIGEDLIHTAAIFTFMKKFICSQNLAYIYYRNIIMDQTKKSKLISLDQRKIVKLYSLSMMKYFFENRNQIEKVNFTRFLNKENNEQMYNEIFNINRTIVRNCIQNDEYFRVVNNIKGDYCALVNKKNIIYI